jgi:hypothetical protein
LVNDASWFSTSSHISFAGSGTRSEFGQHSICRTLASPALREGYVYRQRNIDKLQSGCDVVKVLSDPLDSILRNIISEKGSAGKSTVDFPKETHESHWLALVGLARSDESTEVVIIDLLLYRQICAESFIHEEAVESSTEFSMCFSLEEDPGTWSHESLGHGNNTWLDECRGLEDFVCNITIGGENNEPDAN